MCIIFESNNWITLFNKDIWKHLAAIGENGEVSIIEKILRPILVYGLLVFLFRIFGNRELAQLNPIDLIVLLLLSNTVQNAIIGDDVSLLGGTIGVITLLGINYFFALLKHKNSAFETFIEGSPRILIENGKINQKAIEKELLTKEDLDVIAHEEGYDSVNEIEKCVLDPNGTFLVEGKDGTKDEKFRKDVLQKIDKLTKQLNDLQTLLQKN